MSAWTTRAPLLLALVIASTSALGCGTRSSSPEISDVFGDPDLTPDEWDLAPVKMAVESTYTLEAPGGVVIRGVDTPDASITASLSPGGERVSIDTEDPIVAELLLELERDGVTYEDIPVGLEVLEPDAIALEGEGTEHVFIGDAFSIGYTLEARGELLVGHGFQPFDAPEGVTLAAVVRAESVGLLDTVDRRELSFGVAPEVDGFDLVARRGGQDHAFTRATPEMEVRLAFQAHEDANTEQVSPERVEVRAPALLLEVDGRADGRPVHGGAVILQTADADCAAAGPEDAVDGMFTYEEFPLGGRTLLVADVATGQTLTCEYEFWITEFPDTRQTLVVAYSLEEEQAQD